MTQSPLTIALVGNPNCGKTALFNRLTGARQKVANYAGVTVERKEGHFNTPAGREVKVLDLPGTYSFDSMGVDEVITRQVCLGERPGEAAPDLIVCVADATNLRLHLRFVLEVKALGRPMVLALNLMDAARQRGIQIDVAKLSDELGIPVYETIAVRRDGVAGLMTALDGPLPAAPMAQDAAAARADDDVTDHAEVRRLMAATVTMPSLTSKIDDALDRVFLNPVFGLAILFAIMFVVFQAVFAWATPAMDFIEWGVAALGEAVTATLPEGHVRDFINQAIFGGIGSVIVFLPQIIILFFFILVLEESGYLPRAAFLLDFMMKGAGLSGRAFIPLLSSFACAIPGVMATRAIPDSRDRLTTIMIAPLMTCSARLPVYTLLIAAFIPNQTVWGPVGLQGLVMFGLYMAGIVSALVAAWVMKLLRRDRSDTPFLLELPSYRLPNVRDLALGLWERAGIFVKRITGVIFAANTVLWVLSTFPYAPEDADRPAIDYSFAGMIGHFIEPVFRPIGFGWEICIALIPGLAAREVAVSALGTVYAISGEEEVVAQQLETVVASQWSLATAFALIAWYVFAPQCLATLAVIRRETNSWRTTAFTAGYLFALAYLAAFITYSVTRAITG